MTSHVHFASEWTAEKNASIDWADPEDVLSNAFTFTQLSALHPKLAAHMSENPQERESCKALFLSPQHRSEQVAMLREWMKKSLLTLRSARWCRMCGAEGHTRLHCPTKQSSAAVNNQIAAHNHGSAVKPMGNPTSNGNSSSAAPNVMAKFYAHQQRIERLKLLEEKKKRMEGGAKGAAGANNNRRDNKQRPGRPGGMPADRNPKDLALFAEERRRGTVCRLDTQYNIGFVRVPDLGEVKFFVDNADFGVKSVAIGHIVTFKVDSSRGFSIAIDVRPERPVITMDDVVDFIARCKVVSRPITVLTMLLTHQHEWYEVVKQVHSNIADKKNYSDAVHTFVELSTFIGNREPIHLSMLSSFLEMTITSGKALSQLTSETTATDAQPLSVPLFPNMLETVLQNDLEAMATDSEKDILFRSEQWIEVANFLVLIRQYTKVDTSLVDAMQQTLIAFFEQRIAAQALNRRQLESAISRLSMSSLVSVNQSAGILPSAAELSVPPPMSASVFAPDNLPVNGGCEYPTTEGFIDAQCKLLRADNFEATARLLPAACYTLPAYQPSQDTMNDLEHARLYWKVRFMGTVVTRDRDYGNPESYVLQVEAKSAKASLASQLHQGTAVCITTSMDRTVMDDSEMFWGIVSSCDSHFLKSNMIVVSPSEYSTSFAKLEENLLRNERAGMSEMSMLLETPIFLAGYSGIMKALRAFTGPLAMPLPMTRQIVGAQAAASNSDAHQGSSSNLISYIPPHCEHAFRELTEDIRSRFRLDAGQDAAMRSLPTSDILLVQGPPGTGKSFIGCRVVETYVRYKQMVASGDILQKVSVDMLKSTRPEELLPPLGPVVVITYKNHALDEFLVDLLDAGLWNGNRPRMAQQLAVGGAPSSQDLFPSGRRLVRIGGRSRENRLDPHNLGSLLHSLSDKTTIKSLKERTFVLMQRLDRLTKEILYLEAGRVPRTYFERWLTTEQRQHIGFDDRDAWLRGERYIGSSTRKAEANHFLSLIGTRIATAMEEAAQRAERLGDAAGSSRPAEQQRDDEDVSLSVFQEMKREDESREFNDSLHSTYLSSEAMALVVTPPKKPADVPDELLSLWSLDPVARHEYYAYLIQSTIATKAKNCLTIMEAIRSTVRIRNHAVDEAKLSLLQGADVVGMTTTGCAMNQNLLRSLRPSVLVVEEAAEVLESQLLACMTDSLKQIVLIGDHYQLQPKVDTFMYEKVNHLNLSLFERLARTITPIRLTEQRRMHPSMSELIRPFYDTQPLIDHDTVLTRPFVTATGARVEGRVPGLAKRVFFWRHCHPEEEAPGSRSKVNTQEIQMVKQVVQHLTSEGVLATSITVITPYLGQCRMLRSVMRLSSFTEVRVSTVDLYQGDENDIIVLSLVRTEKLTEFIRMRNRLIVSCSRARFAMIIVGNDALLRKCKHWDQVLNMLQGTGSVGEQLPITYHGSDDVVWVDAAGTTSAEKLEKEIEAGMSVAEASESTSAIPSPSPQADANSGMPASLADDDGQLVMGGGSASSGSGNENEEED